MKIKFSLSRYLALIIWIIVGVLSICVIVKDLKELNMNNAINKDFFIVHLAMVINYMILSVWYVIKIINSGEIRENGISVLGGFVDVYDIRGVTWLSENKLQISFIGHIIHRQTKVKWKVKKSQIEELNKIFEEVYIVAIHNETMIKKTKKDEENEEY